jgi:RRXRR protein
MDPLWRTALWQQFGAAIDMLETRYRKARFDNRRRSEGWLAPSVQHKVDVHLKTIKRMHQLLPVSKTTIEVAQFDIQKIKNPEIEGKEYQGKPCFVFSRRSSGYFDLRALDGTKISASANRKKLTSVQRASACLVERRSGLPPARVHAGGGRPRF